MIQTLVQGRFKRRDTLLSENLSIKPLRDEGFDRVPEGATRVQPFPIHRVLDAPQMSKVHSGDIDSHSRRRRDPPISSLVTFHCVNSRSNPD